MHSSRRRIRCRRRGSSRPSSNLERRVHRQWEEPAKQQQPAAQQKPPLDINQLEANIKKAKMKRMYYVIAAIGIIVIVAVLAYMMNLIKF